MNPQRRKPDWWYQVCDVRDKFAEAERAMLEADDLLFRTLNPEVPTVPHGTLPASETVASGPTEAESPTTLDGNLDAQAQVDTTPPEPISSPSPGPLAPFPAARPSKCVSDLHWAAKVLGAKFCPECGAYLGS